MVGSGASGCQIADELQQAGRAVHLSVSRHKRVPRRYRGKDALWWFEKMGRFDVTIDSFAGRRYPPSTIVTGVNGGYDMNVRRFARDGGRVLGRLLGCADGKLEVEEGADQILAEADRSYDDFISAAEACAKQIAGSGELNNEDHRLPASIAAENRRDPDSGSRQGEHLRGDLGVRLSFDYGWLEIPVLDAKGAPVQERGVTAFRGLYFLGLHWMHTFGSGLLSYVGRDAAYLADHLEAAARR